MGTVYEPSVKLAESAFAAVPPITKKLFEIFKSASIELK